MNTELIEPALTELLQNNRELKAELAEQRKLMQKLLENKGSGIDTQALKELFRLELEKLKIEMRQYAAPKGNSWTLFSNDFQAQNFKVVVETVCKWITIIWGTLYLLSSLFSVWKKG